MHQPSLGTGDRPAADGRGAAVPAERIVPAGGAVRAAWRTLAAILWKDLAVERRSKDLLSSMLVFALLVILIFNFALELNVSLRVEVASGVLWVTFAFAGTLGLNRSMAAEKDRENLDGLLLAPVDRSAIYFGKAAGNVLFMLLAEAVVLPVFGILYNVNLFSPALFGVLLLGSAGYSAVGTLLAAMAVQARTRDVLLPVLLFPVVLPLIIAAVRATSGILEAVPAEGVWPAIHLLLAYDAIFVAVGFMTFEYVVEE